MDTMKATEANSITYPVIKEQKWSKTRDLRGALAGKNCNIWVQ